MRGGYRHQLGDVGKLTDHSPPAADENPAADWCGDGGPELRDVWRQARKKLCGHSRLQLLPRPCLCFARFFFDAIRRSFDARVGLVATRFFGTCSAARTISINRPRASSRLRA